MNEQMPTFEFQPVRPEKAPLTEKAIVLGGNLAGLAMLAFNTQLAEDIFSWVDERQQETQFAVQE